MAEDAAAAVAESVAAAAPASSLSEVRPAAAPAAAPAAPSPKDLEEAEAHALWARRVAREEDEEELAFAHRPVGGRGSP